LIDVRRVVYNIIKTAGRTNPHVYNRLENIYESTIAIAGVQFWSPRATQGVNYTPADTFF
jgi:hypothetical protein